MEPRKNEPLFARLGSTAVLDEISTLYCARAGLSKISRAAMLEIILNKALELERKASNADLKKRGLLAGKVDGSTGKAPE